MSQDELVKGTVQALSLTYQNTPILKILTLPFFPLFSHTNERYAAISQLVFSKKIIIAYLRKAFTFFPHNIPLVSSFDKKVNCMPWLFFFISFYYYKFCVNVSVNLLLIQCINCVLNNTDYQKAFRCLCPMMDE